MKKLKHSLKPCFYHKEKKVHKHLNLDKIVIKNKKINISKGALNHRNIIWIISSLNTKPDQTKRNLRLQLGRKYKNKV